MRPITRCSALVHLLGLAVTSLFVCGCAGIVSSPSGSGDYSISGVVTPAAAANNVTISLSGPVSSSTTTSTSGTFSFNGLTNGTYVLTASRSGYSFTPESQTAIVDGTNVANVDFSGSPGHTVTLRWSASASKVTGYNVYRGTTSGGPYSRINFQLVTGLSFTDSSVRSGSTYYYVCTAVDSAGYESSDSNQVATKVP